MRKAAWLSSAMENSRKMTAGNQEEHTMPGSISDSPAQESSQTVPSFAPVPSFLPRRPVIFAIGNAPTALIELYDLIKEKNIMPALIIGVPVGFVNVVQAKELIMTAGVPYIVARGRKGGSNIAAAIVNALLYQS